MSNSIAKTKTAIKARRHNRIRAKVSGTASRPRLLVAKSNRFTRAILVDDTVGKTLLSFSTVGLKSAGTGFAKVDLAEKVGEEIAKLAKAQKITQVVFDRGGNRYTGRIKAVAEGARKGGLIF